MSQKETALPSPPSRSTPPEDVAYGFRRDAGQFRVGIAAAVAVIGVIGFAATMNILALLAAVFFGCAAYYYYPLIEKRPRIGGSLYGVFVENLGIIDWRAIREIRLLTFAVRSIENHHLEIELHAPIDQALIQDWRRVPVWRALMMISWKMPTDTAIHIALEPFDTRASQIAQQLRSMWVFYRGPIWRRMSSASDGPDASPQ